MVSNHIDVNGESNNFNLNKFINNIDPVVWDAISHLTKSKSDEQQGPSLTKKCAKGLSNRSNHVQY